MEYKDEGFVSGLATSGKGVPGVGYVGAGCTQGRVWLGEWLGWFVTVQSGLLSKFDKTGTWTGLHRLKNHEKLD